MESKVGLGVRAYGRYQCCCCLYVNYDVPFVDQNIELPTYTCAVMVFSAVVPAP